MGGRKIKQLLRLDVGCGDRKEKGWVGMDRRPLPNVDVVHDAEVTPWPLEENSCALIRMVHLWEHLRPWHTIDVMNEMWRIMAPEGQLQLTLPYGWSHGYVQDPTHCNPANETTWQYFDPSFSTLYNIYKPKPWRVTLCEYQKQGNMLATLEPRKEGKPNPIEITPERSEPTAVKLTPEDIFEAFHVAAYRDRFKRHAEGEKFMPTYRGRDIDKSPFDLWRYHELIHDAKPTHLIETGTANGASAFFFWSQMSIYFTPNLSVKNHPEVISIDIDDGEPEYERNPMRSNPNDGGQRPIAPGLQYMIGSSTDIKVASKISKKVLPEGKNRVMVVLDSDHQREHVLKELMIYSPLVTVGQYLVVEDTNINGHPVYPEYGPGPFEALLDWCPPGDMLFEEDKELRDKFPFSANTWLRRVK